MENQSQPQNNSGQEEGGQGQGGFAPVSGQAKKPKKNNKTFIGIVIIVILIILIAVLPDETNEEVEPSVEPGEGGSSVVENSFEVSTSPFSKMEAQTVTYEGHTYKFDDVDWLFADEGKDINGSDQVMVRIQFVNFVRDGVAIDVLPYRLGIHKGACIEIGVPFDAGEVVPSGTPLAFVNCNSGEGVRQLGVYQDGRLIETYLRFQLSGAANMTEMVKIQTIDLAKIVQD